MWQNLVLEKKVATTTDSYVFGFWTYKQNLITQNDVSIFHRLPTIAIYKYTGRTQILSFCFISIVYTVVSVCCVKDVLYMINYEGLFINKITLFSNVIKYKFMG